MVIKVEISEETMPRMLTGKRVEGTLGLDKWTGRKTFNAFCRQSRQPGHNRLIKKTPWGWVKESKERIRVYSSVAKHLGLERVMDTLQDEHDAAMEALIDDRIIYSN